jgi:hypothetical protein
MDGVRDQKTCQDKIRKRSESAHESINDQQQLQEAIKYWFGESPYLATTAGLRHSSDSRAALI